MPVEIRELVIQAKLKGQETAEEASSVEEGEEKKDKKKKPSIDAGALRKSIVKECMEKMREMLEEKYWR